jgi:hypothetical protein
VAARGPAALLAAPVEPTPAFFPDRFTPTAAGARVVAERLLGYAGLQGHRAVVEVGVAEADERTVQARPGAAAWFTGVQGFRCFFGVDERYLTDADGLVASMAHEVAHAFRRVHGLEGSGALPEEPATDATTVFLGFGVLTTNAAERLRTSGEFLGTTAVIRSQQLRLGYLPPQAMAFLLAAQAVGRGAGWRERTRLARHLEPNQRAHFGSARAALARREREVLQALRLPADRRGTPAPRPLRAVEPPVAGPRPPARPAPTASLEPTPPRDDGRPTFRVLGAVRPVAGLFGATVAALPFAVWSVASGARWPLLPGLAAAAWLGLRWGGRRPDHCADPDCGATLLLDAARCPRCRRRVAGTIATADERLEAEERLEPRGGGLEDE